MFQFSQHSLQQLDTCHQELKLLCTHVLDVHDFKVNEGHRNQVAQEAAFEQGHTKLHWPHGNHNAYPSNAVDLLPFINAKFIGWENQRQWDYFGGIVLGIAAGLYRLGKMKHQVRWGGCWARDNDLKKNKFQDMPHFEIIIKKPQ